MCQLSIALREPFLSLGESHLSIASSPYTVLIGSLCTHCGLVLLVYTADRFFPVETAYRLFSVYGADRIDIDIGCCCDQSEIN